MVHVFKSAVLMDGCQKGSLTYTAMKHSQENGVLLWLKSGYASTPTS